MSHRTVREVMVTDVVTVRTTTSAKDVARTLQRHRITGVPVLDDTHEVVGVVTERDLLHKITYQDDTDEWPPLLRRHRLDRAKAHATTARDLMTAPAVTVLPDATIVWAAKTLERHGVTRLPVVDGVGELVGIISRSDLVKVFTRPDRQIHAEVASLVVEEALRLPRTAITVDVTAGVVTLRGRLERRSEAVLATALARRVDGVVRVVDHLTYATDDTTYTYA